MKKSSLVTTTLLTGGVLFGILHHGPVYRDRYDSRQDCEADWSPAQCEPASGSSSHASGYHGSYLGPTFERGARPRTARSYLARNQVKVSRGGFGGSGARFSASS